MARPRLRRGRRVVSRRPGGSVQGRCQDRARCRREARRRSERRLERPADRRVAGRRRLRAGSPGGRRCAGILPGRARAPAPRPGRALRHQRPDRRRCRPARARGGVAHAHAGHRACHARVRHHALRDGADLRARSRCAGVAGGRDGRDDHAPRRRRAFDSRSLHRHAPAADQHQPRRRHQPDHRPRAAARPGLHPRLRRRARRRGHGAQRRHRPHRAVGRPRSSRGTSRRAPPTIARSSATSCWRAMEQHFRPTTTDPGFDVVTENRFFADRAGVEWEELSFSVNGTKWGPDRPAFPLLQAEKVLSPPLDLRLDADYRYRLDGTETIDGAACYVVRFTPNADVDGEVAVPRHGVDRSRDVPPPQAAGGPDRAGRARRLERRDGALRARRRDGWPPDLPADRDRHPPDRAHRRPQHPGREGHPLQRVPAQSGRTSRRGASRRGAAIA